MAWYDEVFEGAYDRFTFHLFTAERNHEEAEFIRSALQLMPGEEVLDIACGHGRHALLLARKGIHITGFDKCERYLEKARERVSDLPARFVQGDLREMDFQEQFDAAYCYFTSFGFFDDDTNFDILRRIARALKPGGRFLLDLQNREHYCSREPGHEEYTEFERENRHYVLLSKCNFDPTVGRASVALKLFGGKDEPQEMSFSIRLYSYPELRWLMKQVGMKITKSFGGSDASPYGIRSPRLVVVAKKTDDEESP